jgi:hypothetical protein
MRRTAKISISLIALLLCSGQIFGQVDTLFWFAAPELTKGDFLQRVPPAPQTMDRPIHLRLTAAAQPATVTITQPAGVGAGYMRGELQHLILPLGSTAWNVNHLIVCSTMG